MHREPSWAAGNTSKEALGPFQSFRTAEQSYPEPKNQ